MSRVDDVHRFLWRPREKIQSSFPTIYTPQRILRYTICNMFAEWKFFKYCSIWNKRVMATIPRNYLNENYRRQCVSSYVRRQKKKKGKKKPASAICWISRIASSHYSRRDLFGGCSLSPHVLLTYYYVNNNLLLSCENVVPFPAQLRGWKMFVCYIRYFIF